MRRLLNLLVGFAAPWRYASAVASIVTASFAVAARPRSWSQPVRNVLARQILFTGLEAVPFVSFIAFLMGVSVVAQAQLWLTRVGQKALLGDILVMIVIREAAPLLTNFVVIGRSGTAIATELASMRVSGEVHLLEQLGIDQFIYLVVPRVFGVMVSVFCLTVIFVVVSFTSGYITGLAMGVETGHPAVFIRSVFQALTPAGFLNVAAKTLLPGLTTGALCCFEGLSIRGAATEVPQAGTRAVVYSVAVLFLVSAGVSVFTYAVF